jgi:hypothetical protein
MANGLFSSRNNAAQVMMLMEAEKAKRIRDAGAGMDPIVASMARAQAGMRESIGALTRTGMGLFGMEVAEDPRMTMAKERDKDRNMFIAELQKFRAEDSDGGEEITEKEMRAGFSMLLPKYPKEAKEFLAMAQSMRKENIEGVKVNAELLRAAANAGMKAADYNAIRKSAADSLNAVLRTDPITGQTSMTINGNPIDTPTRNKINAAIEKAVQAWIDAGGGSAGFNAVTKTFPKNNSKTGKSKAKEEKKKNPPAPPPGFGL